MSQQGMRTFSTEFKQAVVLRLEAGERIAAVADELNYGDTPVFPLIFSPRAPSLRETLRDFGGGSLPSGVAEAPPPSPHAGLMLTFRWKTLSGSHARLTRARRAYFSGP